MTTPVLPYTPIRRPRSTIILRWLLSGGNEGHLLLRSSLRGHRPLEQVWREHADEVIAHHIRRNPGTRPPLWWKYDAPEPRQRLGESSVESEAAYLRRHKLFLPGERKRLRARDFIPEAVDACV